MQAPQSVSQTRCYFRTQHVIHILKFASLAQCEDLDAAVTTYWECDSKLADGDCGQSTRKRLVDKKSSSIDKARRASQTLWQLKRCIDVVSPDPDNWRTNTSAFAAISELQGYNVSDTDLFRGAGQVIRRHHKGEVLEDVLAPCAADIRLLTLRLRLWRATCMGLRASEERQLVQNSMNAYIRNLGVVITSIKEMLQNDKANAFLMVLGARYEGMLGIANIHFEKMQVA